MMLMAILPMMLDNCIVFNCFYFVVGDDGDYIYDVVDNADDVDGDNADDDV